MYCSATIRETLDEYFDGVVLENILSEKLPRYIVITECKKCVSV